ncbi:MAG: hypothetical protein J6M02_00195 [Clostridia bacterium]|nr:hypothetical protein [Clostridia bacterium]
MSTKEEKVVYRVKKKSKIKWGRFVIFVLLIAYIIMFVYTFFSQSVDTTVIVNGEIEVLETVDGYITRNEKIVNVEATGELYPIANEGERVSVGQTVAVLKERDSSEINGKIQEINAKLSQLSGPGIFNNDIALIESDVNSVLQNLMLSDYNDTFSTLSDVKSKIDDKLSKKAKIIGEMSPKGSVERNYYDELRQYEAELTASRTELTAPIAGTVAYKLDGYEEVFSSKEIGNYESEVLEKLKVPSGELVGTIKPNCFKIVDNIEGYITVISSSKNALNAKVDSKVKLRFPEIGSDEITGRIDYITIENGKAILTFRINRGIESLLNYRKIKVDIIWDSASGLKVPTSAIRENEGVNQIYIVNGTRLFPKTIEIVNSYGGDSIIKEVEGESKPYLYDKIVEDAANVKEEKMIIAN